MKLYITLNQTASKTNDVNNTTADTNNCYIKLPSGSSYNLTNNRKDGLLDLSYDDENGTVSKVKISGEELTMTISNFEYTHQIYKPFELNTTWDITTSNDIDSTTLESILLVLYKSSYSLEIASDDMSTGGTLAYKNLIVSNIKYSTSSSKIKTFSVTIVLNTIDYLLTLNKRSACYTGRTLSQITTDLASSFTNVTITTKNLSFLSEILQDKDNKNVESEYRLPYVVQYQESSFDFLCRTARRYGEFVYYSCLDNTLRVGIEKKNENDGDISTSTPYKQIITSSSIEKQVAITNLNREQAHSCYSNLAISKTYTDSNNQKTYPPSYTPASNDIGYYIKSTSGSTLNSALMYNKSDESTITLSNYGLNYNCDTNNPDLNNDGLYYEDYNRKNGFISKEDGQYNTLTDYIITASYVPGLMMAGINGANIFMGLAAVVLRIAYTMIGFHITSQQVRKVYDIYKDSENLNKNANDIYSDYNNAINTQLTNEIDLYSEYMTANEITIYYQDNSRSEMVLAHEYDVNKKTYIVTSISFSFNGTTCERKAKAIPIATTTDNTNNTKNIYYPPQLDIPIKKEAKAQVATVVDCFDPSGLNRVRVLYPWQQNYATYTNYQDSANFQSRLVNASPWLRIAQPMASDKSGFNFMPALGDEVMVNFENGNVETPYIEGSFYTSQKPPVLANSANQYKYIKSANGHSLTFFDNPDATDLLCNILPFHNIMKLACDASKMTDETDYQNKISGYTMLSDTYGMYNLKLSSDERKISISSPYGTVAIDAFQGISLVAPNGDIKIQGKNVIIEAGNSVSITSGTNIKNYMYYKDKAKTKEVVQSCLAGAAAMLVGSMLDLSFFRTVYESFLRPVGGALIIKSHRSVLIAAGSGTSTPNIKKIFDSTHILKLKNYGDILQALKEKYKGRITDINQKINSLNGTLATLRSDDAKDLNTVDSGHVTAGDITNFLADVTNVDNIFTYNQNDAVVSTNDINSIENELGKDKNNDTSEENYQKRKAYLNNVKSAVEKKNNLINTYNADAKLIATLTSCSIDQQGYESLGLNGYNANFAQAKASDLVDIVKLTINPTTIKSVAKEAFCTCMIRFDESVGGNNKIFNLTNNRLTLSQGIIINGNAEDNTIEVKQSNYNGDFNNTYTLSTYWNTILNDIFTTKKATLNVNTFASTFKDGCANQFVTLADNTKGTINERHGMNPEGEIVLSSTAQSNSTYNPKTSQFEPKSVSAQLSQALKIRF